VWEQNLIDLKEGSFIVDEKIQKVVSVFASELIYFYSVFGELGQFQQTLLELLGFFSVFVNLLKLLLVIDFVLESSFHDVFSDFLNAFDKQILKLVFLAHFSNFVKITFLILNFFLVKLIFEFSDCVSIVGFQGLNILDNLSFNVFLVHSRFINQIDKLMEFQVLSRNVLVSTLRAPSGSTFHVRLHEATA
jgi:hypothetical protein